MSNTVLINPFEVMEEDSEGFIAFWEKARDYLKEQPGFISTRLHQALSPQARFMFINVAEWASEEHFTAAVESEAFQEIIKGSFEKYPHFPALYRLLKT